jgi:hypothetical protein
MRAIWKWAFLAYATIAPSLARAAIDPLFASHDVVEITLRGPISKLRVDRTNTGGPFDGAVTVTGATPETVPVKLSVRGITRRKRTVCDFPPIRVEFPEAPGEGSFFSGQKKLKLVTHCQDGPSFQQYNLLEYSAYRLLNVLTPLSFNVRLVKVNYQDPDGRAVTTKFGFFLENDKDVARRNGLRLAQMGDSVAVTRLNPRDAGRVAVFEYMIGNIDWSMNAGPQGVGCCHNVKLVGDKGATTGLVPLPYDFDETGLVDPPYAPIHEELGQTDARDRRYRGHCQFNADAQTAASEILARRAELLGVLDETPQLNDGSRRKAATYLAAFFDQIATPQEVTSKLLRSCRQ